MTSTTAIASRARRRWGVGEGWGNLPTARSAPILLQKNFHRPSPSPTHAQRWSKNIFRALSRLSKTIFPSRVEPYRRSCDVTARRPKLVDRAELIFGPFVWVCCICQCYRVFSVARIVNKALRSVFGVFRGWASEETFSSFHTFLQRQLWRSCQLPSEKNFLLLVIDRPNFPIFSKSIKCMSHWG